MTKKNPLSEGVVGKKLVEFLAANANSVAVDADYLGHVSSDEVNYRITFDDDSVSDWKITFEPFDPITNVDGESEIVSAELFNEVI